jgi:hypothetical protein
MSSVAVSTPQKKMSLSENRGVNKNFETWVCPKIGYPKVDGFSWILPNIFPLGILILGIPKCSDTLILKPSTSVEFGLHWNLGRRP